MAGFDIGSVYTTIEADISGFRKGLDQAKKEADMFGSRISSVADGIQKMAMVGAVAATGAMALVAKTGLDQAAEYEQQVIALTTLLGDQAKAQEHIVKIQKDALKTPFDVRGLIKGNQLLIAAGVEADQAEKDILNLGDAISANGKSAVELERIVVNLQQIKNVGKATEMDMKQFAFNGINMYKLLSDSTKLPIEQLKDMDITYEMVSEALAKASGEGGIYHDANLRQSESLQGLISNLKDTASQALILGVNQSGLFETAKNVVAKLTEWVSVVGPALIITINNTIIAVQNATKFYTEHKTIIDGVVLVITAFFIPALIAVGIQMGVNLVASIASATWNLLMFGVEGWKAIAMLGAKSLQLIATTASVVGHTVATIALNTWTVIVTASTWLFNAALAVLTSPIFLVVGAIIALIAIGYLLIENWDLVKEKADWLWTEIVNGWNSVLGKIKELGGQIKDALVAPFNSAKESIGQAVDWMKNKLDFNKRNSPSINDIIRRGVDDANKALGGLAMGFDMNPSLNHASTQSTNSSMVNVRIDMAGAFIGDEYSASSMAETMGDSIIKKLQSNLRI